MSKRIMNKVVKFTRAPISYAFFFTILLLILFLYTSPQLSRAGDMNISEFLSSAGRIKPGYFFISPVLASILRNLNKIYLANWWSVFSVFTMFLSLAIFLWYINNRCVKSDRTIMLLASSFFSLFIWELILKHDVNFTQTATMSAMAGFCLINDSYNEKSSLSKCRYRIFGGIILLLIAGSVRWNALAMVLPFEVMTLLYRYVFPCEIRNLFSVLIESWKKKKEIIYLVLVSICIVLLSYGIHQVYWRIDPELGEYVKANSMRESIGDYAERYPEYSSEEGEIYDKLGIRPSWIRMVQKFITSDKNNFSSDDLERMVNIRQDSTKSFADFVDSLRGHTILWFSLSAIVIFVIWNNGRKNVIVPLIGCMISYILFALFFVYIGRFEWRVTNGCILAGTLSFFMMTSDSERVKNGIKVNLRAQISAIILVMLIMIVFGVVIKEEKEISKLSVQILDENKAEVLDYIDNNHEKAYFWKDGIRFTEAYNLWGTHDSNYLDNFFPLTANFIFGCEDQLKSYGITDVYNDMLVKANIRVLYTRTITSVFYNYLKDFYDPYLGITSVEGYKNAVFLRFSKQISPDEFLEYNINSTVKDEELFVEDEAVHATFTIECYLNDDIVKDYDDYFINIKDIKKNEVYTYGLSSSKLICRGDILCMNDTWDPDAVEVVLIGRRLDGKLSQLSDLTNSFYVRD